MRYHRSELLELRYSRLIVEEGEPWFYQEKAKRTVFIGFAFSF